MCEKEISNICQNKSISNDNDCKVYRQIIKKSVYDDNIKRARNTGVKLGGVIICKFIISILNKTDISDTEKVSKIYDFCNKTIEKKGGNLD